MNELFERSEFLIATCKKKKTDCVCPDVRQILVLVWKNCLGFSVGYVLCASPYCYIQEKKTDRLCGCVCVWMFAFVLVLVWKKLSWF